MPSSAPTVPVIVFAYARPALLARVLACLCENRVPLVYAFADGAKGAGDAAAVAETRALLRGIDWAEVRLTERPANLGLGRNVMSGVTAVAAQHDRFIVWEDDLIAAPGTYGWIAAALERYASDERVMSITGWTHRRVTPPDVADQPYFDGRAECWVWGAWARSWRGMPGETALQKMKAARAHGIVPDAYGADLPVMARDEQRRNIWAVRWLYHHLQHGGLCLRPPWSLVEHVGVAPGATNAVEPGPWTPEPVRAAPLPAAWPEPAENPACAPLWRDVVRPAPLLARIRRRFWRLFTA